MLWLKTQLPARRSSHPAPALHPQQVQPTPAHKAVWVPAPAPRMQVPAQVKRPRAGLYSILQSGRFELYRRNQTRIIMETMWTSQRSARNSVLLMQQNFDIRSSKNSRLQQTIEVAFRDPKKLLRDPLWGRDQPVGSHCPMECISCSTPVTRSRDVVRPMSGL